MKQADFGQIVKILRKKTSDEKGNPWTRESLSKHLHLSIDQLGRLERGDRKYLDNQILKSLADAFNLTPIERKEFLIAAAGITNEDYSYYITPEEQLKELLNALKKYGLPHLLLMLSKT
jgi:transcriptional regulator with XRE-family HTH domain